MHAIILINTRICYVMLSPINALLSASVR